MQNQVAEFSAEIHSLILSHADPLDKISHRFVCWMWRDILEKHKIPLNYMTLLYSRRNPRIWKWALDNGFPMIGIDIWFIIFSYLDPMDKVAANYVCRKWHSLLHETRIPKKYLLQLCKQKKFRVAKWALKQGAEEKSNICAYAVILEKFGILKRAFANGCPIDEEVCINATLVGRVDILKWARERGAPLDLNVLTYSSNSVISEYIEKNAIKKYIQT
jgi:hypothetical protein